MQPIAERVALIPGGARGMGRSIGLQLARHGWQVVLAYRTNHEAAEATCRDIAALGPRALAVQADVSDPIAVGSLVAETHGSFGRLDALVHAAGPYRRAHVLTESPEGWREIFASNLDALFYTSQAVAPLMKEAGWGRILAFGLAGVDRIVGQPELPAYAIAKLGVLALVRTLARALAPHGITANVISPGYIDTGSGPPGELERMLPSIPAGYVGVPDDAAGAALFLLSDDARYVNGANVVLSGAWGV
jgi:3-oxoacyl-[acyl-carrier protein] reductase